MENNYRADQTDYRNNSVTAAAFYPLSGSLRERWEASRYEGGAKRRMPAQRLHRLVLTGALLLGVILILGSALSTRVRVSAYESGSRELSYASYQIQEGDSLWSIASRYKYAGESTSEFVRHLKTLNGIETDDIHAGKYLLIPTYSYI